MYRFVSLIAGALLLLVINAYAEPTPAQLEAAIERLEGERERAQHDADRYGPRYYDLKRGLRDLLARRQYATEAVQLHAIEVRIRHLLPKLAGQGEKFLPAYGFLKDSKRQLKRYRELLQALGS